MGKKENSRRVNENFTKKNENSFARAYSRVHSFRTKVQSSAFRVHSFRVKVHSFASKVHSSEGNQTKFATFILLIHLKGRRFENGIHQFSFISNYCFSYNYYRGGHHSLSSLKKIKKCCPIEQHIYYSFILL